MDINEASTAIEAFGTTFTHAGASPIMIQCRPSGEAIDEIKVWVDLGPAKADPQAWSTALETAIKRAVPAAAAFKLAIRVETD